MPHYGLKTDFLALSIHFLDVLKVSLSSTWPGDLSSQGYRIGCGVLDIWQLRSTAKCKTQPSNTFLVDAQTNHAAGMDVSLYLFDASSEFLINHAWRFIGCKQELQHSYHHLVDICMNSPIHRPLMHSFNMCCVAALSHTQPCK